MVKKELKEVLHSQFGSFLIDEGFKKKAAGSDQLAVYEKESGDYFYGYNCFANKYNGYCLFYDFGFGRKEVRDILRQINAVTPFRGANTVVGNLFTGVGPARLKDPFNPGRTGREIFTIDELIVEISEMKRFYHNEFGPFVDRISDYKYVNKMINSMDDFWETDIGRPFPIGYLEVTRLVIAKLAGAENYDEIMDRNFQIMEKRWKERGFVYDRKNMTRPEVYAVHILNGREFPS